MEYPKIYLAIDNCFASKRWTRPCEWMSLIKDLGVKYVEASADTECDPLYMDRGYLDDWIHEVEKQSERSGVKVVNFYSGHGTYSTLGLTHTDRRIRDRFLHNWLEPLILMAQKLNAGVGFYCHAFNDSLLQNTTDYLKMEDELYERLSELAQFAKEHGDTVAGVEQMYTPHQIPWTIDGAGKLLREVYARSGSPFYITIDTGHQTGQNKFLRPDRTKIAAILDSIDTGCNEYPCELWLGPGKCYEALKKWNKDKNDINEYSLIIESYINEYPYMFSSEKDGDTYIWLKELGCYSPIIHLQQTNYNSSSHLPFTPENNKTGRVSGEQVLKSLAASFIKEADPGMPPRCKAVYLTLEVFFGTASINRNSIADLKSSVEYWRKYIPEDGLPLDQLAFQ